MSYLLDLRYSDDGGNNYSNWSSKDKGAVGDFISPLTWYRLGQVREERIWEVRDTSIVASDILAVMVQAGP